MAQSAQAARIELARLEDLYDRAMGAATDSNKQCILLEQRLASALKDLIACKDQVDDLRDDNRELTAACKNLRLTVELRDLTIEIAKEGKAALDKKLTAMYESYDRARAETEALRTKGVASEMNAANLAAHTLRCGADNSLTRMCIDDVCIDDVATEVAGAGSDVAETETATVDDAAETKHPLLVAQLDAESQISLMFETKSRGAKRKPVEHEQLGAPRLRRRSVRLLAAGAGLGLGGSVAL